jgi:hypothetical protein
MVKVLFDEDFDGGIQNGIRRRRPDFDLLRAQDAGLSGQVDPVVLAHAAQHNRIVISHDRRSMPRFAIDRIEAGQSMPGLFIVSRLLARRNVIQELLILIEDSRPEDWNSRIAYLPIL